MSTQDLEQYRLDIEGTPTLKAGEGLVWLGKCRERN